MPDLIEKFFQEDLNEAEEQALSEMLSSSEDAAEKLGGMAETAYSRFGHPKPQWPGAEEPPWMGQGGFKPLPILLALALVGGLGLWAWKHREAGRSEASSVPGTILKPAEKVPQGPAPQEKEVTQEEQASSDEGSDVPEAQAPKIVDPAPATKVPAKGAAQVPEPRTILKPINLDEDPTRKFSSISVKINQAQVGMVKVRVVDMGGLEVTPLFEGALQPGHWIFDWDGKLGNGTKVAPGYYQIEVQSGAFEGKKNIRIQSLQ